MTKRSHIKHLCIGVLALAVVWTLAEINRTRNPEQEVILASKSPTKEIPEKTTASSPSPDSCFDDARNNDAAYKRVMRAHEYRNIVHDQLAWSGGVWMAKGPNCTLFTIMTGQQEPESFKTYFHKNLGSDLCSYGFTDISFDGDLESLNCEARMKRHRTH